MLLRRPNQQPANVNGFIEHVMIVCSIGVYNPKQSVHQVCAKLKSAKKETVMPTPFRCTRAAPPEFSAYTDGSWPHAAIRHYALGGSGVWRPNRAITKNDSGEIRHKVIPLSSAEKDIAFFEQQPDGASLFTKIGGFSCGAQPEPK